MTSTLHLGDCLDVLRTMPDASVHCCVTSPPYWGLRDYGHDGQIGLEATPEEYVDRLVGVFREVRRVLRDDGTLWLNLGDSYNAYNANRGASTSISDGAAGRGHPKHRQGLSTPLLKNKDLVGIPWRVAFALQSDGWYLRQDIIWHKPNPMPESVTDRCTKAHEYVFLLSKSARYYYDANAIKDPASRAGDRPGGGCGYIQHSAGGHCKDGLRANALLPVADSRNRRDVWTIASKPFHGAHFAVMPPALVEPCILAGCPKGGVVLDPFTGSGTGGEVALLAGRQFVGIELNPEYHAIAERRIHQAGAAGHQPDLFDSALAA
jgi:DNA modification methylase